MVIRFRPDMSNYPKALAGYQMKTHRNVTIQTTNIIGGGPMMMPCAPLIGFWGGFGMGFGSFLTRILNQFLGGGGSYPIVTSQGQGENSGKTDADKLKGLQKIYDEYQIEQTGDGKYTVRAKDGNKEVILSNASLDEISETLEARHKGNTGSAAGKTVEQKAAEHNPKLVKVGNDWVEENDHSKKYEIKNGEFQPVTQQEQSTDASATQQNTPTGQNTPTQQSTAQPQAGERPADAGTGTGAANIPSPPQSVKNSAAQAIDVKAGADIQVTDYGEKGGAPITGATLSKVGEADTQNGNFPKSLTLARDGKTISYNLVSVKDGVAVYQSPNGQKQTYFLQKNGDKLELMQPKGDAYTSMGSGSADGTTWQ